MKQYILATLSVIGELLKEQGHKYEMNESNDRFTLSIDERMKDVGMSPGYSVIDCFYEETTNVLFIGMLRIPKSLRGTKFSSKIVSHLKKLSDELHLTLMVDACDDCDRYWKKQGFRFIYRDQIGYDILAYSKENERLKPKWEEFKNTTVFKDNLFYHA